MAKRNIRIPPELEIPGDELEFTYVRSSGPGGQNVNKVNTKAVLRWPVVRSPSLPDDVRARFLARYGRRISNQGELVLSSQRYRDQSRNVNDCLEKLKAMLVAVAEAPIRRRPTRPTAGSQERRIRQKQLRSRAKTRRRWRPGDD